MHALGVLCLLTGHWGVSACHTLACVIGIPLVTKSLIIIVRMLGCCKYSVRFRNGKAAGRKNCGNGAKKCGKRARRGCVRSRTGAQRCGKRLHGICSKGDTVRPHSCRTGAQMCGNTAVRCLQQRRYSAVASVFAQGRKAREKRLHEACSKGDTVRLRPYSHRGAKAREKRLHGTCSNGDTVRLRSCPHRGAKAREKRLHGTCSKGECVITV